jgi:predicted ATP-grasp superfamily ATP-dependent carboligase
MKLVMCSISKKKLYDFCLKNKIPTIKTEIYKFKKKNIKIKSEKIVIKPDQPLIGKKNVYLLDQNSKKNSVFFEKAGKESLSSKVIVQPYIDGEDLNLSVAVSYSKIIWYIFYKEKNYFKGKNLNSYKVQKLDNFKYISVKMRALKIVKRVIKKNRITGFINFSFRKSKIKNDIYLYEVNPGLPGDNVVTEIFERSNKRVNFYLMDILLMSGIKPNLLKNKIGL